MQQNKKKLKKNLRWGKKYATRFACKDKKQNKVKICKDKNVKKAQENATQLNQKYQKRNKDPKS